MLKGSMHNFTYGKGQKVKGEVNTNSPCLIYLNTTGEANHNLQGNGTSQWLKTQILNQCEGYSRVKYRECYVDEKSNQNGVENHKRTKEFLK